MNVQFLDNYNTDGLTTSIGHNGWVLNGQIFLNLYEKDPQKPNQTNKQICLIIDSYKKLPFPFITWHKKNSDLKGGFFWLEFIVYYIIIPFYFFFKNDVHHPRAYKHTCIWAVRHRMACQRQDISPLRGLNLPVVELWPWDHETFLDFSPNFNHL